MEANKDGTEQLPYYRINMELTRGYIAKLKYLRRDKDEDVKHRLNRVLATCKFEDKYPVTMGDKTVVTPEAIRTYPKKYKAEFAVPVTGFTDRGFRPGALLDALRTEFGDIVKGDIKILRSLECIKGEQNK